MVKKVFNNKQVFISIVLFLLLAIFFCGNSQVLGHQEASSPGECTSVILSSFLPTKDNATSVVLLVPLLALVFAYRNILQNKPQSIRNATGIHLTILSWRQFVVYKLFNPILQALRRGILHPQIYNFAVATR